MYVVKLNSASNISIVKTSYNFFYPDNVTLKHHRITKAMQLNKLVLNKNKEQKLVKIFKDNMSQNNFCMHLIFSKIFCSSSEDALIYMDSWFLMISETVNFCN